MFENKTWKHIIYVSTLTKIYENIQFVFDVNNLTLIIMFIVKQSNMIENSDTILPSTNPSNSFSYILKD